MHRAHETSPPVTNPPLSVPRQNKVIMQRQYRGREGECFSELREIIKQLTEEELQTRYEILKKAIELLYSLLENMRQEQTQVAHPPYEMPVTTGTDLADAASTQLDYPAQSPHWLQPSQWQNADFGVQPENAYYTTHSQEYSFVPNTDTGFEETGYQEFDENWSNERQF